MQKNKSSAVFRKVIMMPKVIDETAYDKPIIRKKAISAQNNGDLATNVNFGDVGKFKFDEPIPHGGTGCSRGALCMQKCYIFSQCARNGF